ncbi:protein SET DOMAIN GROUP 41 isoform X2 [Lotus japonicus]|uniref:protein SET DOMAIN GROUP 41 isoform X2 n=1 Tax=Lotus japonicus TaxID=34305 RepID=UPI00258BD7F8|nr:protein SET DOMAIN GROUP 41 isoform X2 [Lotus japonicus]
MEMEMEMKCMEDIDIATDLTPTLSPLSFSLHNSHLHTHCSACFSPLPNPNPHSLFYCSPLCSAAHSALRLSSADSSLLRTALRLLLHHRPSSTGRIAGLLSNRHLLTCPNLSPSHDDVSVSDSVRAMAAAIAKQRGGREQDDAVLEDATVALCAVLTNAVEVHDSQGCALGIAVFEPAFSWINHSCSPNACYRFTFKSLSSDEAKLRIAPFNSQQSMIDSEVCGGSSEFGKEWELGYGPRLIVRSIKRINKGDEVTVAYTDLLQPKAMRQSELWSKYRFNCCCQRCSALPFTYVDHALQEISVYSRDSSGSCSNYELFRDMVDSRLAECIDNVISEYLSVGDPDSCCEKLEKILMLGLDEQLEIGEGKQHSKFILHPLHHLSLIAYTTLASAYKVRGSDLLCVGSEINLDQFEAFDMSRISAAYSLLLAGATHHLFKFESSLIASIANFWTGAGESLLSLTRNSGWNKFVELGLVVSKLPSIRMLKCSKCSLMVRFRACISNGQIKSADFETVSNEFLHCVSHITQKVWSVLVYGCNFMRSCKDPINFSWLWSTKNSITVDIGPHGNKTNTGVCFWCL